MIKKYLLSFITAVSCIVGAIPGEAGAPELLKVKASKASYQIGEKAFIQVYTPVQPSNQAYEYYLTATLDQVSQKVVTVSVRESYILTNPLVDGSSKLLKVSLFLQDKKFAKDTRVSIQIYKKRNAEIDERLLGETNEAIRSSLIAQKNRNLNFIAQAELNLTNHRSLLAESSHSILMNENLMRSLQASPVIQVWRDRANGKYFTGEYPNFFVKVKSGMQLEDGPAEFVSNGRDVDSFISFSRKKISDREFTFTGRKLTVDDFGLKNFEASVFFRSKTQADSIRTAIANIGNLQKQYVASRNQTTDVAEKEYYNLLIAELDEAKVNYNNQLNNMLMALGAVTSGFEVGPASSDLFGVTVLATNASIEEGVGTQVTVTLNGQPTHAVSVRLNPSEDLIVDGAAQGEPVELNFTTSNWNVPQAVSVLAIDDHIDRGDSYTASVFLGALSSDSRYSQYEIAPLNIVVSDNDEGALLFDGDLNLQEGGSGSFRVKLKSSPTAPVTVSFATDGLSSTAQALEFDSTNWSGYQEISVQAVEDLVDRGELVNSTITVSLASADSIYNSLSYTKVAQITDNDLAGIDVVETDGDTKVSEGGQGDVLQVRLTSQPTVPITIAFETGSQIQPVALLTFSETNWNLFQSVQVSAVDDSNSEGDHSGGLLLSAMGGEYSGLTVSVEMLINDNDVGDSLLDAGLNQGCNIWGDSLYCWGYNWAGGLGVGDTTNRAIPTQVTSLGNDVKSVSIGAAYTCATKNKSLYCWGANHIGQLGDGSTTNRLLPVQVVGMSSEVAKIAAGREHACAIKNSLLYCWGDNNYGQLGIGTTSSSPVPQLISLPAGVVDVSAGYTHTCAILVTGKVYCWGDNNNGQIGDGTATSFYTVPTLVSGISDAIKVGTSVYNSCVIVAGGKLKCWGSEILLGRGLNGVSRSPVDVPGLESNVTALGMEERTMCAVHTGAAKCWGKGLRGGIGNGSIDDQLFPTVVSGLSSGVTAITFGDKFACGNQEGVVKCWGANEGGSLGNNSPSIDSWVPVNVIAPSSLQKFN